jgi:membrane protease YdiL (CAAX protease family)
MKRIFLGPNGLRSGWSFLLFLLFFAGLSWCSGYLVVDVLHHKEHSEWYPTDFILFEFVTLVTALVCAGFVWLIEGKQRSFGDYGLSLRTVSGRLYLDGLAWGLIFPLALMLLIGAFRGVSFSGLFLHGHELLHFTLLWAIAMALIGFSEEYLFRGFPLYSLARGIGFWPASLILSALFGGIHYFTKPMETVWDALNVGLLGLFLCFTILRTGNIWWAAGFHGMFDFAALILFGAPNTGNQGKPVPTHILNTTFHGPAWLTGGVDGIEASILLLPLLAIAAWIFHRRYPQNNYHLP